MPSIKKNKVINDPIYGLVDIDSSLVQQVLAHRFFQRLRRIQQLSCASYIYPAACHSRFSHSVGAYHLMRLTLQIFKNKGIPINEEEFEAACLAILMHDLGHTPFSHTLENQLIPDIHHEDIGIILITTLNNELKGQLELAIKMFKDEYSRPFFHQLISSNLDVDRLDYLTRDSFFTGVKEGHVANDRIIQTLNVHEDHLVLEEKGAYSIEDFLIARRLMYWQVYNHKSVIAMEQLLINIFDRLKKTQNHIITNSALAYLFQQKINFKQDNKWIEPFCLLDDIDIISLIKNLKFSSDKILSTLSTAFMDRNFYSTQISTHKFSVEEKEKKIKALQDSLKINEEECAYFYFEKEKSVNIYNNDAGAIKILRKNGSITDLNNLDYLLINQLSNQTQSKYYQGFWRT